MPALSFVSCLTLPAQPIGNTDALFSALISSGSVHISTTTLWSLRPDGTYFVLRSHTADDLLGGPYSSGATGTYSLIENPANPNGRILQFDTGPKFPLDFRDGHFFFEARLGYRFSLPIEINSLANTSTRAFATATEPAIAGFVIPGTRPRWVLVRGIGPGLANFGVTNPLAKPRLMLYHSDLVNPAGANTGWDQIPELVAGLEQAFKLVGAFPLARGSGDCALLVYLDAGSYTAHTFSDQAGGSGSVLTEVYILPYDQ